MIQPPSILLMGVPGSGKTHSISTLLESGLEVFVVSTEPHGLEALLDACAPKNGLLDRLHWSYLAPARPGFNTQVNLAKLIASSNQAALAALPPMPRADASWIKLLNTFVNFHDDRTGKDFGDVTTWDASRALVVDSLSGVSAMAMDVTIGDKVTANPGEWGIAMRALDKFILNCTSSLNCFFVMTAHTEKELDELTGVAKTMVSTLGKKLAPTVPRFFSEVALAHSESKGDQKSFYWSTNEPNTVLKNRALPIGSRLAPSFQPIVQAYRKRLEQLGGKAA
jgi:AAA domain-containing protein